MENASKALEMAAGVMLGVLLFSLVAYFFTSISSWPEQQDDEKSSQQTAQFNLEFEVYDKKGMYGADVISCLTKAENNNEKYYEGGSFLSGQKYGETYWVNVYVNLKSDLEEQLIVYHMQTGTDSIYKQVLQYGDECKAYKLGDIGFKFDTSDVHSKTYTFFDENTQLESRSEKISASSYPPGRNSNDFINKDATLISDNGNTYNAWLYRKVGGTVDTTTETPLQILLDTCSSNIKQIVTNKEDDKDSLEAWSSAEWRTALYDFKMRKFRCDNIKYSEVTGRVNEIYFSEI